MMTTSQVISTLLASYEMAKVELRSSSMKPLLVPFSQRFLSSRNTRAHRYLHLRQRRW